MFDLVCVMVHIKEPLELIGKRGSPSSGGSRFPMLVSEWSI